MSQELFLYVATAVVCIAGISMIAQALLLFGIFRSAKETQARIADLQQQASPLLSASLQLVSDNREKINETVERAAEVAQLAQQQMQRVDVIMQDVAKRSQLQIARIDSALEKTVTRVQETSAAVQSTILTPVREINGLLAGLRAAMGVLAQRSDKASVDRATQDEEMFI